MNVKELVKRVAALKSSTIKDAEMSVSAVFDAVKEALTDGEEVKIMGFGTFKNVERPARMARNPQNGKQIKVPARSSVKFKPGAALK